MSDARRNKKNTIAMKRMITFMILLSWTTLPKAVNASSTSGAGTGWFNKVFPGKDGNGNNSGVMDGDQKDKQLNQSMMGSGSGRPPLPPGPGGPFMPPPPPPQMGNVDQQQRQQQQQQQQMLPPPPPQMQQIFPPPPPSAPEEVGNDHGNKNGNEKTEQKIEDDVEKDDVQKLDSKSNEEQMDLQSWQPQHQNQQEGQWGNMPPPPQEYDSWHNQQMMMTQQNQPPPQHQHQYDQQNQQWMEQDQTIRDMQSDIDNLITYQDELYTQVQNLTSSLLSAEHTSEQQLSQIDLLLEQVADAEAYASAESNAALEYKTNCTNLGKSIETLQSSIQNLEQECADLKESAACDADDIALLKKTLKKRERELENMACGIEMARFEKERKDFEEDYEKKIHKKGFLCWLFGWDSIGGSEDSGQSDEDLENLQNLAKSTLLNALQSERNNVDELENALSASQQNNSAIAEMVVSRDSLIDELNDRVAVFEEDKVVLKAALRQLQKEMKDEAPKTQKLISELKTASSRMNKLEGEVKTLNTNHTSEIGVYNQKLAAKDQQINEIDSKMSMISRYVDQLEERLASFAIARRDIANREEALDSLEEKAAAMEEEIVTLKQEAEDVKNERDEMKNLVDLLVEERTLLQEEKIKLRGEKEKLVFEGRTLREELDMLNDNFLQLDSRAQATQETLEATQASLLAREAELENMKTLDEESTAKLAEQEELIQKSVTVTMALQEEIQKLMREKETAAGKILSLQGNVEQLLAAIASKAEAEAEAEAEAARKAEEEAEAARKAEEEALTLKLAEEEEEAKKLAEEEEAAKRAIEETQTFNESPAEEEEIKIVTNDDEILTPSTGEDGVETPTLAADTGIPEETNAVAEQPAYTVNETEETNEKLQPFDDFTTIDEIVSHPVDDVDVNDEWSRYDAAEESDNDTDVTGSTEEEAVIDIDTDSESESESESEKEGTTRILDDDENAIKVDTTIANEVEAEKTPFIDAATAEANAPPLPNPNLPPPKFPRPNGNGNRNRAFVPPPKRAVPLRNFRKRVSKLTGIHGFFTPPSRIGLK